MQIDSWLKRGHTLSGDWSKISFWKAVFLLEKLRGGQWMAYMSRIFTDCHNLCPREIWSWSELWRNWRWHKNVAVTKTDVGTCVEFPLQNLLKWGNSSHDIRNAIPCRLTIPRPKTTTVFCCYCNSRVVCSQHFSAILWITASVHCCSKTRNARTSKTYGDRPLWDCRRCSRRLGVRQT